MQVRDSGPPPGLPKGASGLSCDNLRFVVDMFWPRAASWRASTASRLRVWGVLAQVAPPFTGTAEAEYQDQGEAILPTPRTAGDLETRPCAVRYLGCIKREFWIRIGPAECFAWHSSPVLREWILLAPICLENLLITIFCSFILRLELLPYKAFWRG